MDPQSSGSTPPSPLLPEVHIDMSSEGTIFDEASEDNSPPAEGKPVVKVNEKYRALIEDAVKGHWKAAEKIIGENDDVLTDTVMTVGQTPITVLQFAVIAARDRHQLIMKLVGGEGKKNYILRTALYDAARRGRIMMVKALLREVDAEQFVPHALSYAISKAPVQKEVIWHLARQTGFAPDSDTMSCLILAGHMDIGLFLAHKYPEGVISKDNNCSLLGDLAKMKSYFRSGDRLDFWEKCIYKCIPLCLVDTSFDNFEGTKMARALKWFKTLLWNYATKPAPFIKRIGESKLRHKHSVEFADLVLTKTKKYMESPNVLKFLLTSGIVLDSASRGTHEIVELCLDHFPELMWEDNFPEDLMKEVVNGRQVDVFRLVNAYNIIPYWSDKIFMECKLMEAVVKWSPGCAPADVPGAAFLMHREFQWFKVLEDLSDPSFKTLKFQVREGEGDPSFKTLELVEAKEKGGKTYWEVFVEQRQDLLKEAGQWMKETSSSCSLVATLIITVAFTAAFTVPGGNDQTGIPNFLKKDSFMIFVFADALALFSSVTATVMFLAIATRSYTIEDILHSLPRKMIIGITFLFLSLAFMLVAFIFALTIVLSERFKWIYIPIPLLAAVPVCFFLYVQVPLYVEMVMSFFWPRLRRPWKHGKKRGWDFNFSPKSFRTKAS